ncbi:MAG: GAF domain-containing protein [Candidatus Magnetominusculus sp. LBB02]|nr:GAF domain-containing protein [Candidatus Magnetominusculus sp. LBB02]
MLQELSMAASINSKKKRERTKTSVLYFDMEGSSKWINSLGPVEVSESKEYLQAVFKVIVSKHACDDYSEERSRGDDGYAYFADELNCIKAAIEYFDYIPEMVRMFPHLKHIKANPRLIAFSDIISGGHPGAYTGVNIEAILPLERNFGEVGFFRIIGDMLYMQLDSSLKGKFKKLLNNVEGKNGASYEIYEYYKNFNMEQIRKRYLPPFMPKFQEALHKFFSNNLATRTAITLSLTKKLFHAKISDVLSREHFTKTVLDCCRAYLELTVSSDPTKEGAWKFKVAYWDYDYTKATLSVYSYSYPDRLSCYSFDNKISINCGDNIVGQCFKSNIVVIMDTNHPDYQPLHGHRGHINLTTIAAFPVIDPNTYEAMGVLTVDTRVEKYFTNNTEEIKYHEMLLSSFTSNLALAKFLTIDKEGCK